MLVSFSDWSSLVLNSWLLALQSAIVGVHSLWRSGSYLFGGKSHSRQSLTDLRWSTALGCVPVRFWIVNDFRPGTGSTGATEALAFVAWAVFRTALYLYGRFTRFPVGLPPVSASNLAHSAELKTGGEAVVQQLALESHKEKIFRS